MIRPMTMEDVARVAEIHVFGWRSTARGVVSDKFLFEELSVVDSLGFLEKAVADEDTDCFVYDDGIIKGYLMMGKCKEDANTLMLKAVYVDPQMQGVGVGFALLDFFEQTAKDCGCTAIRLLVVEGNKAARSFYKRNGYVLDGTRNYLEKMDTYDVGYIKWIFDPARFVGAVVTQDAEALSAHFGPDAVICWHDSNEQMDVAGYIRANCEYPGDWQGSLQRVEKIEAGLALRTKIWSDQSVHMVSSFLQLEKGKIIRLDECFSDVGEVPQWRKDMNVSKPIERLENEG